MRFTLADIAAATGGHLVGEDVTVDGVSIDSREEVRGALFVPIVAERDGHDFLEAAVRGGASAHLTAERVVGIPAVVVDDTSQALSDIGRLARDRLEVPVVAVTGSVGKTTTKDLLAAVLGKELRTHASYRSFNNELGVPLTLANTPDETQVVVVEMGARGTGHIAELCAIARPQVGLVFAVGAAHTELFGGLDAVAAAKGELISAIPDSGTAILNADDERVAAMASLTKAEVVTFGARGHVRGENIVLGPDLRATFDLVSPWGSSSVTLGVSGAHLVLNACAAAAAALVLDVDIDSVAAGLETAKVSPLRMEVFESGSGAVVINDAYNANPMSMNAAIDALLDIDVERRIAVLGVMAELGELGRAEHERVAERLVEAGVEMIAVDAPEYGGVQVADVQAVAAMLADIGEGVAVLVKGSRVAGLERLVGLLDA